MGKLFSGGAFMKKLLLLIAVLIMTSACSPANTPEAGQENVDVNRVAYGLLGPGPINYGVIRDDKDEYRYDGMINQSPSFRTLDRHRHDLGDDQDKVRLLLREEGVQPGAVFIIGKDLWVYANVTTPDAKEREKTQAHLKQVLTKAMQRYDVHVRINQ